MWKAVIIRGSETPYNVAENSNIALLFETMHLRYNEINSVMKDNYGGSTYMKIFEERVWAETEGYRVIKEDVAYILRSLASDLSFKGTSYADARYELSNAATKWMERHVEDIEGFNNEARELINTIIDDEMLGMTWSDKWLS